MSSIDEHRVVATRAVSPAVNSMNTFTLHATDTGWIAWSMESGDSGSMDGDFLIEGRKVGNIACA